MKTVAKKLTVYGNLGIVQFMTEPTGQMEFAPGAPEIRKGGLIISETTGEGVVGQLMAVNHTGQYLLLTDADILIGAKQNRVLNHSILAAPFSKTILNVSCIERLRWHYVSEKFNSPSALAEHDLRKEKAKSLALKLNPNSFEPHTQSVVWSYIHDHIRVNDCSSPTESYADLINQKMKKIEKRSPMCEPEGGCNGMAVIIDHKVVSADIFGKEEVYRFYFPLLRDSAYRVANLWDADEDMDDDEGFFRALDFVDHMESAKRQPVQDYHGAGSLSMATDDTIVGQELKMEGHLVHVAMFGGKP